MFAIKITEFFGKKLGHEISIVFLGTFFKGNCDSMRDWRLECTHLLYFFLMYFLMVIPGHWQKVGWKTCKSPNGLNRVYLACPTSCITKGFLHWTPILMVISVEALISNQTGTNLLYANTLNLNFFHHFVFIYASFMLFSCFLCLPIGPIQDVFEPIHVGQIGSFNPNQTHLLFVVGVVKSTTSMSNGRSTSLEKKKKTLLCLKQLGFQCDSMVFFSTVANACFFFKC